MKRILAISGSTRISSSNHRTLEYLQREADAEHKIRIFSGVDGLPHFNEDLDANPPEAVKDFRQALIEAHGVIFCSPEYVFSLPGSFKNALDWLVSTTVLYKKPLAMIVAAANGEDAFHSLRRISETLGASILDDCTLLVQGARGKFESNGAPNPDLSLRLRRLMQSFHAQLESATQEIDDQNPARRR